MPLLLDLGYLCVLMILSPWLGWRTVKTGRYRRDLAARLLGWVPKRFPARNRVWFHGVSVGEIHLLATLIPAFSQLYPKWDVVISSTTETGLAEARRRFVDLAVIPWPFDFSWAVGGALDAVKPQFVVLVESEMWPNFLGAAGRRGIPVAVVNARMSPRSFGRLRRAGAWIRRLLFDRVTVFAVQDADYAERFERLGVPRSKLTVTGSIKFDGARLDHDTPAVQRLARLLGLAAQSPRPLVLLAGSTHEPEEAIVLAAFGRLRDRFPGLRLILVPRHPDRFEAVSGLVQRSGLEFVRRSRIMADLTEMPSVVVLDSIGELGAAWGLADVGFTGGSLDGRRGGQSMIEPAGFGVPVVFGPHVWNFRDVARRLVECGGARVVADAAGLEAALAELLADVALRNRMGAGGRQLVASQQGATQRTLDVLATLIPLR